MTVTELVHQLSPDERPLVYQPYDRILPDHTWAAAALYVREDCAPDEDGRLAAIVWIRE